MAEKIEHTTNWPDLAIGPYDRLTGRGAEITYEFENMEISVPSGVSDEASHAIRFKSKAIFSENSHWITTIHWIFST